MDKSERGTAWAGSQCGAESEIGGAVSMGKRGKHCTAIVLAAGQGRRMGGNVSKQYLELAGKPIIYYTLEAFQNSPLIDSRSKLPPQS